MFSQVFCTEPYVSLPLVVSFSDYTAGSLRGQFCLLQDLFLHNDSLAFLRSGYGGGLWKLLFDMLFTAMSFHCFRTISWIAISGFITSVKFILFEWLQLTNCLKSAMSEIKSPLTLSMHAYHHDRYLHATYRMNSRHSNHV